ncbi:MAG: hypothetical protein VKQ33_13005 [Candidatus Sericytochromatia bacterium]|nr:hypothetical protein [Candidatus Sericytochromatia bacterium]
MDPRNPGGGDSRRRQRPPRDPATPAPRLRAVPPPEASPAQADGFPIRLDPNSPPGEFNFVLPQAASTLPAQPFSAATDGPIPPFLAPAVDEVLGFLFGLDQPPPPRGKRP